MVFFFFFLSSFFVVGEGSDAKAARFSDFGIGAIAIRTPFLISAEKESYKNVDAIYGNFISKREKLSFICISLRHGLCDYSRGPRETVFYLIRNNEPARCFLEVESRSP